MRGGALPPALLCAALGLALSFAPRHAILRCIVAMTLLALAVSFVPIPTDWTDLVFLIAWGSIAITAATVHLPKGLGPGISMMLAVNSGIWSGALISVSAARLDLLRALPCVLLCVPGAWLVATKRQIAIKVAASWLIAIALLAASLTMVPTPGYKPDHMD